MSIEEAIMGGIVFKGKKDKPKEEEKGENEQRKKRRIFVDNMVRVQAKMKADIRKKES